MENDNGGLLGINFVRGFLGFQVAEEDEEEDDDDDDDYWRGGGQWNDRERKEREKEEITASGVTE